MGAVLEDLRMLKDAERIADGIWKGVVSWDAFAKDVVGGQLARAADSIGANIAESYGRFHYGEKLKFLYYARGSLYETKFWLNRALARQLLETEIVDEYARQLGGLARQLNAFINSIKQQRGNSRSPAIREETTAYAIPTHEPLFSEEELNWLESPPD
ncbi:MAG: four helix bundle protein [Anaerolineales bacterium]|nr:four helix bundle protein [Anaerolineales bacterium]